QRAKRQRRRLMDAEIGNLDQFETAAAEIADKAVRMGNAGENAKTGVARFLTAAQDLDIEIALLLDLGDEFRAVLRFTHGRSCRDHDPLDPHIVNESSIAAERLDSLRHGLLAEPPGGA